MSPVQYVGYREEGSQAHLQYSATQTEIYNCLSWSVHKSKAKSLLLVEIDSSQEPLNFISWNKLELFFSFSWYHIQSQSVKAYLEG